MSRTQHLRCGCAYVDGKLRLGDRCRGYTAHRSSFVPKAASAARLAEIQRAQTWTPGMPGLTPEDVHIRTFHATMEELLAANPYCHKEAA